MQRIVQNGTPIDKPSVKALISSGVVVNASIEYIGIPESPEVYGHWVVWICHQGEVRPLINQINREFKVYSVFDRLMMSLKRLGITTIDEIAVDLASYNNRLYKRFKS